MSQDTLSEVYESDSTRALTPPGKMRAMTMMVLDALYKDLKLVDQKRVQEALNRATHCPVDASQYVVGDASPGKGVMA